MMLSAKRRHRHFSQTMLALHAGALLSAAIAAALTLTLSDMAGWKRVSLMSAMLAALELVFFLPVLRRFRKVLAELGESESRKSGILESSLDPVMITDVDGKILDFNPAAELTFGRRAGDAVGQRLSDLFLPEPWRSEYDQSLRDYAETGDGRILTRRAEIGALRSTGEEFPAELTITPVHGIEKLVFTVCIRDISDRRQAEGWLIEARESAISASRVKSDFLANISHELRTPMNTVIGMTSLLLGTRLSSEQKEYVTTTRLSADMLLTLLNELLDLSKIEAGKMELEIIDFDLLALVRETAEMLRYQALAKKVALEIRISPEVPVRTRGDPGRIRQILMNLITNAVKFTDRGHVSVNVSSISSESGHMIRFEVADTGAGIPVSAQARLFQPFSQADSSTTRKYGGTGLGLAICKRLVALMNGEIGLESRERHGSLFWFRIPLQPGMKEGAVSVSAGKETLIDLGSAKRSAFNILVAEDNAVNLRMAMRMLEKLGYRADPAGNGREAIEAVARARYDLVLMDCQMPEMDGYQASSAIRAMEHAEGRRIPIIAVSGNVMSADRAQARASGMDDFLAKPVTIEALARMVDRWLRLEGSGGETAPPPAPAPENASSSSTAINATALANLKKLENASTSHFLADLIRIFTDAMPDRLSKMRQAILDGDCAGIVKAAHALKTSSASLGALSMSAICRKIEEAGTERRMEDMPMLLTQLESEYARAKAELEREARMI